MKLETKWYNTVVFCIMVVFFTTAYRILRIIIEVELGHVTMNSLIREELMVNLRYLGVVFIMLFIRKKEPDATPLKSEA